MAPAETKQREPYLFRRYPGLRGKVPWMPLGLFPTPAQRMDKLGEHIGCGDLYVKRDDLSGEPYGGNKVRKLEFSIADVVARKRDPVITIGAAGSNHVLATTVYAKKAGISTVGVFVPQPVQEYVRKNILCNSAQGCQIEYVSSDAGSVARIIRVYLGKWLKNRRRPYLLWAGGSSTLGIIGYVEGALEIASQVEEGILPEPEFIFVPVGSAGTFAGLVLGMKLAGLESTVVGVRVYDKSFANEKITAFMARRANRYLRRLDPKIPDLDISSQEILMLHDYYGSGYANFTQKGVEAVRLGKELEGLKLEGTYTGKSMAGLIDFMGLPARRKSPALFINTYNSAPLDPLLESCPGPEVLPGPVREYFEKDVAEVEGEESSQ